MIEVRKTIILLFAVTIPIATKAGEWRWNVREYNHQKDTVLIEYTRNSFHSFNLALESIPTEYRIKHVRLGRLVQLEAPLLQSDIHRYMKAHYAIELKNALTDANDLNGQKLKALIKPFGKAVLSTRYVAELNKALLKHHHTIVDVSFEKLIVLPSDKQPLFDAIVWLVVERNH
jgi:hypothetical protein